MGRDPQFDTTDTPTIIRNFMFEVRIFVTVNHIFFGINELICIFVKLVYMLETSFVMKKNRGAHPQSGPVLYKMGSNIEKI